MDIEKQIRGGRIIAILRGLSTEATLRAAQALYDGGVRLLEVPFDSAGDPDGRRGAENIAALNRAFCGNIAVGAGTVVSVDLLHRAAEAGAAYIISPNTDAEVIRRTKALGLFSIPGAMTPSEILSAYRAGADMVKIFPAAVLGAPYIKAVRGPLPQVPLIAVGGVGAENAAAFLKAGCIAVACGGKLCDATAVREERFADLTAAAAQLCGVVRGA